MSGADQVDMLTREVVCSELRLPLGRWEVLEISGEIDPDVKVAECTTLDGETVAASYVVTIPTLGQKWWAYRRLYGPYCLVVRA